MDVRIGITQVTRELLIELPEETDRDKLQADLHGQLASDNGMLRLVDRKGKVVMIPVAKVAYVEIGTSDNERRIGFGG